MKTVYMSFSTDMLHSGHIAIIEKAAALGQLTIGVLTDQVIASYKRYPLLSYEERVNMLQSIRGVYRTVEQNSLSYADNLRKLRPDYVVHGDDWKSGVQKPIRDEVVSILNEYGGELVEYPYSNDERYRALEQLPGTFVHSGYSPGTFKRPARDEADGQYFRGAQRNHRADR